MDKAVTTGCWVNISSYSALQSEESIPAGAAFAVVENDSGEDAKFEQEVKGKISKLLAMNGYKITSPEAADYIMRYTYSVESGTNVWEATWVYDPKGKYALGSFSHNTHRPTHAYLAQFSASVMMHDAYERRKDAGRPTQTHSSMWMADTYNKMAARNYKDALDYMIVGAIRKLGQYHSQPFKIQEIKEGIEKLL